MHHRLVDDDFLIALGENKFVFQHLPHNLSWVEIPIIQYGSRIIRSATGKLSIEQICPLIDFINDNSLVEYLVGWAFEDNKLNEEGIKYLKDNFEKKYNLIKELKLKNEL